MRDVRAMIDRGALVSGDKLPSMAELAEQYECSAGPVKMALRLLDSQGVIETRQGRGSFVR